MHTARQFSCYALSRVVYRLNLLLAVAGLTWLFEGGTRGLTVVGRVGTRDMLEWHKARVSGVTGVYTPLLRRLRHTHKKRGLVAYTVRSKVAMLKYSATCQRALEEGLVEREGGALRTTWCCGAALLYIARTCPSLKSLSHTDS